MEKNDRDTCLGGGAKSNSIRGGYYAPPYCVTPHRIVQKLKKLVIELAQDAKEAREKLHRCERRERAKLQAAQEENWKKVSTAYKRETKQLNLNQKVERAKAAEKA